jgi:hypothetical protein
MRRWRIKEDWIEPLLWIYVFGWMPASILAQVLFARGGMNSTDETPFLIVVACWFGPAVLAVIGVALAFLISLGSPVERLPRADETVALQDRIAELERELEIGQEAAASQRKVNRDRTD